MKKTSIPSPLFLVPLIVLVSSLSNTAEASPYQWIDWIQEQQPVRSHVEERGEDDTSDKSTDMDDKKSATAWESFLLMLSEKNEG